MREIYKQVRREKKKESTRLTLDMPADEIEAFDRWAAGQSFSSRAAALRQLIKASIAGDAATAA